MRACSVSELFISSLGEPGRSKLIMNLRREKRVDFSGNGGKAKRVERGVRRARTGIRVGERGEYSLSGESLVRISLHTERSEQAPNPPNPELRLPKRENHFIFRCVC